MKISKIKLLLISLCSGALLTLSWIGSMAFAPLVLIALIPMLWVEQYIFQHKEDFSFGAVFRYTYLPFLLFCAVNTLWVSNATPVGLIIPVFEACFMALVFQAWHFTKKALNTNKVGGTVILILYWIAFEWLQFVWDINFPWLNFGNTFASYPILIQWYSVLGMEGGSLWVLLANLCIFTAITHHKSVLHKVVAALVLVLPIAWSLLLWYTYEDEPVGQADVIVVQPNLDPYNEQYNLSPYEVTQRSISLIDKVIDDSVDYVLLPESAIQEYAWEHFIDSVPSILIFNEYLSQYPKAELIAGMSSRRLLPEGVKTVAARKFSDCDKYYESCNIAVDVPRSGLLEDFQLHHKTILTVGVEKVPFKKYLSFMENLALDLGGTIGTLGTDSNIVVFTSKTTNKRVGVAICYESVDGNYIRQFTHEGAQALLVMTNDGWWGDTPGYKQHFLFSRLRAIENRRYIARSANTGLSGFISPRGEILQKSNYWQQDALRQKIVLQDKMSFFALHGDVFSRPMAFISLLLLMYSFVRNFLKKKEKQKYS